MQMTAHHGASRAARGWALQGNEARYGREGQYRCTDHHSLQSLSPRERTPFRSCYSARRTSTQLPAVAGNGQNDLTGVASEAQRFWRREIGIGYEDNDGRISCRDTCRWSIACGFGTEHCRQAGVRHQECREIAISRGRARRFGEFRVGDPLVWPRRPVCSRGKLARSMVALGSRPLFIRTDPLLCPSTKDVAVSSCR